MVANGGGSWATVPGGLGETSTPELESEPEGGGTGEEAREEGGDGGGDGTGDEPGGDGNGEAGGVIDSCSSVASCCTSCPREIARSNATNGSLLRRATKPCWERSEGVRRDSDDVVGRGSVDGGTGDDAGESAPLELSEEAISVTARRLGEVDWLPRPGDDARTCSGQSAKLRSPGGEVISATAILVARMAPKASATRWGDTDWHGYPGRGTAILVARIATARQIDAEVGVPTKGGKSR